MAVLGEKNEMRKAGVTPLFSLSSARTKGVTRM